MTLTCLLIEQNDELIHLMERYCQGTRWQIMITPSSEAVERARDEQPAAILLGADLPGDKGWAVLHALKSDDRTIHTPVVMYASTYQQGRVLDEGADECLLLPFLRQELLAALEKVLGMRNEPAGAIDRGDADSGLHRTA